MGVGLGRLCLVRRRLRNLPVTAFDKSEEGVKMQTHSGFHGVHPVAFALFGQDDLLHRDAVRAQVQAMLRHNVHGIAVLGLASEVHRLSTPERHALMEWVIEDAAGQVPVAVTIAEPSLAGQIDFARAAEAAGASWLVLQPPPVKSVPEADLIRFFGAVADRCTVPVAIQNAPEYLGIGLSVDGIAALNRAHANVSIIKLEATATVIDRLHQAVGGSMDIFNGRAGIDMIEALRAGAVGFIPGGESYDVLTRVFNDLTAPDGDPLRGEALYREVLPLLVFLMESIDNVLLHGKAVLGHRLGIAQTAPRAPFGAPSAFTKDMVRRYAAAMGAL